MDESDTHFSDKFRQRVYAGLILLAVIAVIGIAIRIINYIRLWYATEQQSVLTVATISAAEGPLQEKIVLPGNVFISVGRLPHPYLL